MLFSVKKADKKQLISQTWDVVEVKWEFGDLVEDYLVWRKIFQENGTHNILLVNINCCSTFSGGVRTFALQASVGAILKQ